MRTQALLLAVTFLLSGSLHAADKDDEDGGGASVEATGSTADWSVAVPGFVAPKPGEHPRLFFRKADVPALRKRAETPEGKQIIARLKAALGGGEAMPTSFRSDPKGSNDGSGKLPPGTFTYAHAAGFGFLYQVTGDKKYAELAQQCAQKDLDGQRDIDNRYAYIRPYSTIRGGPSLAAMAIAYDLCYDAWPEDFRTKVALDIQGYRHKGEKSGKISDIKEFCLKPNMGPHSNHFGPMVGGGGTAVLAILGDPGTDTKLLSGYLDGVKGLIIKQFSGGMGSAGFFNEGPGPGQIGTDTSFVPMLQAMKVAGGRDYISPRPHAQWTSLRWSMWLVNRGGEAWYPMPGKDNSYGSAKLSRAPSPSRSGQFAQGFGMCVNDDQRAAMLWTYQNIVEPAESKQYSKWIPAGEKSFDVIEYPHRAIFAFVNWPIGISPKNPGEVLPRVAVDDFNKYYFVRNQWKDQTDIVAGFLCGSRDGAKHGTKIWGMGQYLEVAPMPQKQPITHARAWTDGSLSLTTGDASVAADFSKTSGAEGVFVLVGSRWNAPTVDGKRAAYTAVTAGATTFHVITFQSGDAPAVKAEGDKVSIGAQSVSFTDGKLHLAKTGTELKLPAP